MTKKRILQTTPVEAAGTDASQEGSEASPSSSLPEYDLIGDVVFEPPLTPDERRRRGVGVSIEERLEQMRRRLAASRHGF